MEEAEEKEDQEDGGGGGGRGQESETGEEVESTHTIIEKDTRARSRTYISCTHTVDTAATNVYTCTPTFRVGDIKKMLRCFVGRGKSSRYTYVPPCQTKASHHVFMESRRNVRFSTRGVRGGWLATGPGWRASWSSLHCRLVGSFYDRKCLSGH